MSECNDWVDDCLGLEKIRDVMLTDFHLPTTSLAHYLTVFARLRRSNRQTRNRREHRSDRVEAVYYDGMELTSTLTGDLLLSERNPQTGRCRIGAGAIWGWVKIKPPGDLLLHFFFHIHQVPFWVPSFDPRPFCGSSGPGTAARKMSHLRKTRVDEG